MKEEPIPSEDRKTVLMLGCFDTKAEDFNYLYACLTTQGANVIAINTGVRETNTTFPIAYDAAIVAGATDQSLAQLNALGDRGLVVRKMGEGAAKLITRLLAEGPVHGAIGMGGGGGTYIALSAMQAIPVGIPKLCLSTVAAKDLSRQVGTKDITLMPSIVDVAGLNRISRVLISQAAGAIWGMMHARPTGLEEKRGTIAISMFGNTTACVERCTALLKERDYEVLAFHAVGVGGRTMEALIRDGFFDGVLDLTTTELADELCDGICSAGPDRLSAAGEMGVPQVVAPGCLDMVNYGHMDTVPERFNDRLLYAWAPDVTLMRTNEEENRILGRTLARKLNQSTGNVRIMLPLKGISIVSAAGGVFHHPETDKVLFDTIKKEIDPAIPVMEIDATINDHAFADQAVETLLQLLEVSR